MRLGHRLFTAALFVVIVALQLRFTVMTVDVMTDTASVPWSPQLHYLSLKIINPDRNSVAAGAREEDALLAEDGVPIHSVAEAARLIRRHRPGERTTITLRRGSGPPFLVTYEISPGVSHGVYWWIIPVLINIITPWCCILLGFLVAFRRPGDPVAYSLLFFLICASQMLHAVNQSLSWDLLFAWIALFLGGIASRGMIVSWLWFAIQFPDPTSPHRVWPWGRWALGVPFVALAALQSAWYATAVQAPRTAAAFRSVVDVPDWPQAVWSFLLALLGIVNFAAKLERETNPSVRRRLRWVVAGLSCGVFPILLLFGIGGLLNREIDSFPMAIVLPAVFSPFLIPLTLAYAVLVNRLFDIGVFVRQGLLASKSIAVIRIVLLVILISLTVSIPTQHGVSLPIRIAELIACVVGIVATRRAANRLRKWVDGRFFQEVVNTEHLLIELSGEVRRLRDAETLLRTVTDRIANALHVSRVAALMPQLSGFVPAYAFGGLDAIGLSLDDPAVAQLRSSRHPLVRPDDVLVPISTGEDLQGILSLGPKRSEEPYSGRDLALLESVAGQTALALENTRLTATIAEEAAHRERITSELEIARTVQERLFPKCAPNVPGLDLAGRCQPAQTVGGDYYDFFTTPSGAVGFAIGDIAGKGVPAALLMASLQASLRGLTLAGISDLADLMEKLNTLMYDASPANRFATFFCCLYDAETRTLRYSSAGHNPALLWRAGAAEPQWLKTPGTALGLRRKAVYQQAELTLEPGDRLVLYTDGVTEARNLAGEEFEEERLANAILSTALTAQAVLEAVLHATNAFAAGATQHDDITVIAAVAR